jgi:hypothetical protein
MRNVSTRNVGRQPTAVAMLMGRLTHEVGLKLNEQIDEGGGVVHEPGERQAALGVLESFPGPCSH